MTEFKGPVFEATRALQLAKKRLKMAEELEIRKTKIEKELQIGRIDKKFASHYDAIEQELRSSTIGLVTLDQMKSTQESILKEREKLLAQAQLDEENKIREKERKKAERLNKQKSSLSFAFQDDDGEEEAAYQIDESITDEKTGNLLVPNNIQPVNNTTTTAKRKFGKDPTINTSFLPDKEREEEEKRLREQLRQEWVERQERIKNEEVDIVFSYWDGSGHRRTTKITKGSTIQQFLAICLNQLKRDDITAFPELKTATIDSLMYVKEDIIIPHHYTFYDLILTKARGKSGPLFSFDAHDDIRIRSDASVGKDETHAGKVVLRSWYEKNKHIFPASRWEPYDPLKKWENYTVADHYAKDGKNAKILVKK